MLSRISGIFGADLAIDLGTANTLVGVVGEGLVLNEPSIVAVEQGTRRVLSGGCAVGHLAKQIEGRTPQSISVVRPLAAGVIADFVLCEAMLKYFIRKAARQGLRARPRVLVAVPGCITPVEKRAVFNSTLRAGARQVFIIDEAKAAAIGAGLPIAEPVASLICDIGGGTTEVAVLSLGEIVASQSIRVGGDALDRSLVDYLRRHYSLRVSTSAAEQLRIEIGSAYPLEEERSQEIAGVDAIGRVPRKATITSEEVREALGAPLAQIVEAVKATLDDCGTQLASDLIDNGLVLAGGGSLVRGLDRFFTEQTGLPTRVCNEPLSSVARGAYICMEHFARWRGAMQSSDEDVQRMPRPELHFDWQSLERAEAFAAPAGMRRPQRLLTLFALGLAIVLARAVQLEISDGEKFRQIAARPTERLIAVEPARGRILSRDGTLLATDVPVLGLAVQFRYFENPPNPAWLKSEALKRLPRNERRDKAHVQAMQDKLRAELVDRQSRLVAICDISTEQWHQRAAPINSRVHELAAKVNRRRIDRYESEAASEDLVNDDGTWSILRGLFSPPAPLPPSPVLIVEETSFHRLVDEVPEQAVAELRANASRYPGVKIVEYVRREYPQGTLAAHLVGHVGAPGTLLGPRPAIAVEAEARAPAGLMGIEGLRDRDLAGQVGQDLQTLDHRGRLLSTARAADPINGADVVLSIDARLQRAAQTWLERALRPVGESNVAPLGGAAIVIDIRTGELLVAASAPGFDPNAFVRGGSQLADVLADPRGRLFDRSLKMALPPGSVFKPLSALALVENGVVKPETPFHCQGYWDDPDHLRCQIFRQYGIGHGDVTLADALAQSCNVFFFQHAVDLGGPRLLEWASRLGLGRPVGLDLAGDVAGRLPTLDDLHRTGQVQMFAIGQGPVTTTPLQIAQLYAAIASRGYIVTPRVTVAAAAGVEQPTLAIAAKVATWQAVQLGLERAIEDPNGTAYETARSANVSLAGKTGTAETGSALADHAWFAGYAPSDEPKYAFVVVLQHGGSGATAAAPIAKNLLERMQQLGYFSVPRTARKDSRKGS